MMTLVSVQNLEHRLATRHEQEVVTANIVAQDREHGAAVVRPQYVPGREI